MLPGQLERIAPAAAPSHREVPRGSAANPSLAIGYLRAFVTLMVLAQHSMLAYHPFAPVPLSSLAIEPRSWLAFPVVDSRRSSFFLLLLTFNDIFGMSLMFYLSGLFVWQSLERKGSRVFLRDRVVRLGIPFVVAAIVLTPLAYYPSYLATTAHPSVSGFREEWLAMGIWPAAAGPAWFIWLLLAFDAVAAGLFARHPKSRGFLEWLFADALHSPAAFYGCLVVVSTVAYVPLAVVFGPSSWSALGPFKVQTSRVLLYLVYFVAGCGIGIVGIERGLLAVQGDLARRWSSWLGVALVAFLLAVGLGVASLAPGRSPYVWGTLAGFGFTLSCAASSLAVVAVFVRFVRTRTRFVDSLRDNAYGMYLVHFVFVGWLQHWLLSAQLPAEAKGSLVFLGTAALSWTVTSLLRRIPAIARII